MDVMIHATRKPLSTRAIGRWDLTRSGMSGAVLGASGGVGDDACLGAGHATFDVADGTVQAITQDVKLGTVGVGCNGV